MNRLCWWLGPGCMCTLLLSGSSGCGGAKLNQPNVDTHGAAVKAFEQYDTNGDGLLTEDELASCPGMLLFRKEYDINGDGISLAELEKRLELLYGKNAAGLMRVNCELTSRGRPLASAKVRFVPESFLGDSVKTAVGETDQNGEARIAIPDDQLPESDRGLSVMQAGIFRVEIEHPKLTDQEKKFGWEVSGLTRVGDTPQIDIGG